jgi:hypothetical protein
MTRSQVHVNALGLEFTEKGVLNIELGSLSDIPQQVETFVEHKLLEFLENTVAKPFTDVFDDAKKVVLRLFIRSVSTRLLIYCIDRGRGC